MRYGLAGLAVAVAACGGRTGLEGFGGAQPGVTQVGSGTSSALGSSGSASSATVMTTATSTTESECSTCGTPCGPLTCAPNQYCARDTTCRSTAGTCVPKPSCGPTAFDPVCGTDGQTYSNVCAAQASGVDVTESGGCPAPPGWIDCGDKFCNAASNYCIRSPNDVGGPRQPCAYYSCAPLPVACQGKTDCACFVGAPNTCGAQCSFDGGFQVLCPGG
jgi:hypothetical protein